MQTNVTLPPFLTRGHNAASYDRDLMTIIAHFQALIRSSRIEQLRGDAEMLMFLQPSLWQEIALRLPRLTTILTVS